MPVQTGRARRRPRSVFARASAVLLSLPARAPGKYPASVRHFRRSVLAVGTTCVRDPVPATPADIEWRGSAARRAPAGSRRVGFSAHPLPVRLPRHVLRFRPAVRWPPQPLHSVLPVGRSALPDRLHNARSFPADASPFVPDSGDRWRPDNRFPDRIPHRSAPPVRAPFPHDGIARRPTVCGCPADRYAAPVPRPDECAAHWHDACSPPPRKRWPRKSNV
ncbi:Uncharacterised protein [Providencia rustigianii]|nr:Uncharacterised protein [Providencia rustigianii]